MQSKFSLNSVENWKFKQFNECKLLEEQNRENTEFDGLLKQTDKFKTNTKLYKGIQSLHIKNGQLKPPLLKPECNIVSRGRLFLFEQPNLF